MALNDEAKNTDFWSFSVTSFSAVILIVTLRIMIVQRYYTALNWISILLLSVGLYFGYSWAANYLNANLFATMPHTFHSIHFYFTLLLTVALCFLLDLFFFSYHFNVKT